MKPLARTAFALSLAIGAAGVAAAKDARNNVTPNDRLIGALRASVMQAHEPPGQSARPDDPDMGDDRAAQRAILTVCTKDTPAARRSAICEREPVSPD